MSKFASSKPLHREVPARNGFDLFPFAPSDFQPRTRLVFGAGAADEVGELARDLGAKRVLLVTDPGIVTAGHATRVSQSLLGHVEAVTLYDQVHENPTTADVEQCKKTAAAAGIDFIVGLGGGSSMDTAKGCNFLLTNGGRMQDYWGVGKAGKPMLPLIAIPTTAGTGSECQSAALITDEQTHQKMACLDSKSAAKVAILDPLLTVSQPHNVTACTGIDAIAHAVESAVTTKRNAVSMAFSREAFRLCAEAFPLVLKEPQNLEARGSMLLGAAFAGIAIEQSMLGAAHSMANPLTAHYGIVHGHAVGLVLPHVIRFNSDEESAKDIYHDLSTAACTGPLPEFLTSLLKLTGLACSLSQCGVQHSTLSLMAEEAARQWTATFNPRPIFKEDFLKLYEAAL